MEILTNFPIKKIEDVFLIPREVHTVGRLAKQIGEDQVIAYIEVIIFDFIKFVNPVRSMTSTQIKQTAELIIESHALLKIPEVVYVFKLAKKSYFGQIYEGIDGMKILSWFDKYFQERLDTAELISEKEHKASKLENTAFKLPKEIIETAYEKMKTTEFVPDPHPLKIKLTKEQEDDEEYRRFKQQYNEKNKNI